MRKRIIAYKNRIQELVQALPQPLWRCVPYLAFPFAFFAIGTLRLFDFGRMLGGHSLNQSFQNN
jgi:hypothetical protein